MVAIVERSTDTRQTLLYNELKVPEKKALFLGAYNYWQDAGNLSFDDKLQRIRDLTIRNERVKKHTLHFSVNFHPADNLTDKQMKQIAHQYMRKIGFTDQPWLLYRHIDAGHPHMHIVTTSIRPDGSRINNDNLGPRRLIKISSKGGSALCFIVERMDDPHIEDFLHKVQEAKSKQTKRALYALRDIPYSLLIQRYSLLIQSAEAVRCVIAILAGNAGAM